TTPATYSTTVLLRSSVSSFGVDFSPPGQTKSGAYGATVTYTMQVINRSPIVNDFTVALLGNSWTTTVSTDTLTNVPPNGSVPIVVSSTVPTLSTLGASDTVVVSTTGQLPSPGTYWGATAITTTAGSWVTRVSMPVSRSRGAAVLFPGNPHIYT